LWLIVGLGNPGKEYDATRHNIGFDVVDELSQRMHTSFRRARRASAVTAEGRLAGQRVVLAKPLTFMNRSGDAVAGLLAFYRVPVSRLVVVHDELDLPLESLRIKAGGGSGGHNGLKSVGASIGTVDYYRVRVGIGRPPGRMDPAAYVLRRFSASERDAAEGAVHRAADAVQVLVGEGLAAAQNGFNS
jgi:peptidyl-tRNA hydrolase, PTH1 family